MYVCVCDMCCSSVDDAINAGSTFLLGGNPYLSLSLYICQWQQYPKAKSYCVGSQIQKWSMVYTSNPFFSFCPHLYYCLPLYPTHVRLLNFFSFIFLFFFRLLKKSYSFRLILHEEIQSLQPILATQ